MGQIRSRLVTFTVSAKHPEAPNGEQWEISLQGNRIREDKADWLETAYKGGWTDIKLTRVTAASKRRKAAKEAKADIARQGLAILDRILANRKA